MSKIRTIPCLMAALIGFAAPLAQAEIFTYSADLFGAAEAPPNASPGTGFATVTIDADLDTMLVKASFSGLTDVTTAAHIHCCTADAGAGAAGVATQTPSFVGFPLGVTAGSYEHLFDLNDAASYRAAFVTVSGSVANAQAILLAGLASGRAYFNIHTTAFPGGEIRGFLIPEPDSLLLAALAFGTLLLSGRRRAKLTV